MSYVSFNLLLYQIEKKAKEGEACTEAKEGREERSRMAEDAQVRRQKDGRQEDSLLQKPNLHLT